MKGDVVENVDSDETCRQYRYKPREIKTRKDHRCQGCLQVIPAGSQALVKRSFAIVIEPHDEHLHGSRIYTHADCVDRNPTREEKKAYFDSLVKCPRCERKVEKLNDTGRCKACDDEIERLKWEEQQRAEMLAAEAEWWDKVENDIPDRLL